MRICLLLLVLALGTAQAETDLATYTGADREQKLLVGAKKEGALTLYTSAQADDIGAVAKAFEARYGIPVQMWRAGSEKVMQRVIQEARGGRHAVDVIETNGPEMEALSREKILLAVKSPHHAELVPAALRPHGEWVGTRLNVYALAYNTKQVRKDELPKTYAELADPRWKGRLGIEADDQDWLAGVLAQLGEQKGIDLFRKVVKTNGMSVRRGHTLLANLVASGEVPLALTVYSYKAEQLKNKGAPIDWFVIGRAPARANGAGVARRAPHPHAALLFYDFELSEEAQRILAQRDFVPASKRVDTPLNKVPLQVVDPKMLLDDNEKWTRLFDELFVKPR